MPRFYLAYHDAKPRSSPEEGKRMQADWRAWTAANAAALIEPNNPFSAARTITADGDSDGAVVPGLMGYSVLQADDIDAAAAIARTCPFLVMGRIELRQIVEMG